MSYLSSLTPQVLWSPPDPVRDRPIMGAFLGEHSSLIVETGASPAHARQFLAGLTEWTPPEPRFAALTHWHWDHVFGTATMDLPTLAHQETRRLVQEMARLDWRDHALDSRVAAGLELPFIAEHVKVELTSAERGKLVLSPPEIVFSDAMKVDLGGVIVHLQHVGGDHSPDSTVIYSPETRVAFLGDCLYSGFIGSDRFYTLNRVIPLLDKLEALPVDYFVLSHHPAPLSHQEFMQEVAVLRRTSNLVSQFGRDRDAIIAHLPVPSEDPDHVWYVETVDDFMRGLLPDVPK